MSWGKDYAKIYLLSIPGRGFIVGQAPPPRSRGRYTEHVSYFPQQDMEINFDVEIKNTDVDLINKVREQITSANL